VRWSRRTDLRSLGRKRPSAKGPCPSGPAGTLAERSSPVLPPGPVTAAALVRGEAVEKLLAQLARECGLGPDLALVRALAFFRRFARLARKEGSAPETYLRRLLRDLDGHSLRRELSELRERVAALTCEVQRRAEPAPAEAEAESALEIFRRARAQRRMGRTIPRQAKTAAGGAMRGAAPSSGGSDSTPTPRPPSPSLPRATSSLTIDSDMLPESPDNFPNTLPDPAQRPDYEARRTALPKITF